MDTLALLKCALFLMVYVTGFYQGREALNSVIVNQNGKCIQMYGFGSPSPPMKISTVGPEISALGTRSTVMCTPFTTLVSCVQSYMHTHDHMYVHTYLLSTRSPNL